MTSEVRQCSVARALELVGSKWTLLIIRELLLDTHRFDEIVRFTGAPRDILTARLRSLEAEGVIERVRYEQRPERFEYHLTPLGRSLGSVIATLREFGDRHLADESGPPATFLHSCGHDYHPALACRACGEIVRRGEISRPTGG